MVIPLLLGLITESAVAIGSVLGAEAVGTAGIVAATETGVGVGTTAVVGTKAGLIGKLTGGITATASKAAGALLATGTKLSALGTEALPKAISLIEQGQQIADTIKQIQELYTTLQEEDIEDLTHALEQYSTTNIGEKHMEIQTTGTHTKSVASQGLGVTAVVLGSLGTLALLNQGGVGGLGFGSGFAPFGGGRGSYGGGAMIQQDIVIGLADENALLKAKISADHGDDQIWRKVAELDKEIALNRQATEFLFRDAKKDDENIIAYVNNNFVPYNKYLNSKRLVGGVTGDGYTMTPPTTPTDPPLITPPVTPPTE
jgi:hypothetical protein